jgi:hypothetical protein
MSIRLFVVIGNANAGKSTVIRRILCPQDITANNLPDLHSVRLQSGGFLRLYARLTAFQELGYSPDDATALLSDKRNNVANNPTHPQRPSGPDWPAPLNIRRLNALISLRLDECDYAEPGTPVRRMPAAWQYIDRFIEQGFEPYRLAILPNENDDSMEAFSRFLEKAAEYERYGTPIAYGDPWHHDHDSPNWKVGLVRNFFGWA